jgi:exosortase K
MKTLKPLLISYAAPYAMGAILAAGLKYHYSIAGSDELRWVLSPTSWMVQQLTGIPFEWEQHAGYVSRTHGLIIAPSCSGVNFLIMAFCSFYFTTGRLMPNRVWRFLWLGIAFGCSYALTLGVNGLRISAAVHLYGADVYGGWLTPERAHRVEGTLIYFSSLLIMYLLVNRIARCFSARPGKGLGRLVLAPFLWYCLIALGIPLLNKGPLAGGPRFVEHSAQVLSLCAGSALCSFACLLFLRRLADRIRGRRRGDSNDGGVVECAPP